MARTKKTEESSVLKTLKIKKKAPRKRRVQPKHKVTKRKKKITEELPSIGFPGQMRKYVLWDEHSELSDLIIGDEVQTACGYNGYIVGIDSHDVLGPHITLYDKNGNGYHTVLLRAVFKVGDGKNDVEEDVDQDVDQA